MTRSRPGGLCAWIVCVLCSFPLAAQQPQQPAPAKPKPEAPKPAAPKPASPKPPNPFENVPQAQEPKPEPPKLETPKPPTDIQQLTPDRPPEDIIDIVEFRGARRVPQDTLRALIFTKKGDKYDE